MSKIADTFSKGKVFIGFLTAGDPNMKKSEEYILEMERAGAGIIEIGIPFSDPVAEGAAIQEANIRALSGGADTDKVFGLVESVRRKSQIPLVFLTYLNPVFNYGYERFFRRCEQTGVDGIIIPDLPFEEQMEVKVIAEQYGVDLISLIAPTSQQRIQKIAAEASGFIYLVSSMGVTGVRNEIETDMFPIIETIKEVTHVPVAVGFGIHTPEQSAQMLGIADGVIVGSAIVKIIEKYGEEAGEHIYEYVKEMSGA